MKRSEEKRLPRSPFPPYLAFFIDNPFRRLLIDRRDFLTKMGIREGDRVLELGCGPGFFTEILSEVVGEKGRVYAQDVEEKMMEKLKKKLSSLPFSNVVPLLCDSAGLELPDRSCDVAFCANVFEEIYEEGGLKESVMEVDRILKEGGLVIVKEHRFGGTKKVMEMVEDLFLSLGYGKEFQEKTCLSYHMRFRKPEGVTHGQQHTRP